MFFFFIKNNKFGFENEIYIKLNELLKQRDPFNKPPTVINTNERLSNTNHEAESISGKESVQSRMKSGAKH